mmetsp:Transcript_77375/g.250420  ORF Transcript_77375/g.250420 Transcript_77375/m.250420 type:complete len:257 (+) Transcript_77375:142-912(+)
MARAPMPYVREGKGLSDRGGPPAPPQPLGNIGTATVVEPNSSSGAIGSVSCSVAPLPIVSSGPMAASKGREDTDATGDAMKASGGAQEPVGCIAFGPADWPEHVGLVDQAAGALRVGEGVLCNLCNAVAVATTTGRPQASGLSGNCAAIAAATAPGGAPVAPAAQAAEGGGNAVQRLTSECGPAVTVPRATSPTESTRRSSGIGDALRAADRAGGAPGDARGGGGNSSAAARGSGVTTADEAALASEGGSIAGHFS